MKLNLRDLFWLTLTLGIGLAWYASAFADQTKEITVREGEIIAIISIVKGLPDTDMATFGTIAAVSRERLQVDSSIGPGLPYGVAINSKGELLGLT